jgi:TPR repeat protein
MIRLHYEKRVRHATTKMETSEVLLNIVEGSWAGRYCSTLWIVNYVSGGGAGVERDKKKELHLLEVAAIGGHDLARHNLRCLEERNGRLDRAVKHWIIAAKLGYDGSLNAIKEDFKRGLVRNEDFAALFMHIRLPWMWRKFPKGRKQK